MKSLFGARFIIYSLLAATLLAASDLPLFAQSDTNDDYVLELPLVESPPQLGGTFWRLSDYFYDTDGFLRFSRPPRPVIPLADQGLPVYYLTPNTNLGLFSTNSYVIDDSSVLTEHSGYSTMTEDDSGSDSGTNDFSPAYSYPSNSLYLIIDSAADNTVFLRAMGTESDQIYELLSRESLVTTNNLAATNWISEGTFIGAENQDWTPTTVAVGTRTNQLWLWCRSWADPDQDGLPSWWEMQYGLDPNSPDTGNTGVADGDKNAAGDGWSNIYKFEHGMNPTQFYMPPPPQNVDARLDATGTNIVVTWSSGGGSVAHYRVVSAVSGVWVTNTVASSTLTFASNAGIDFFADPLSDPAYMVIADFSNGAASASPWVVVDKTDFNRDEIIVRGPAGGRFLTMQSPPAGLSKLRLYWDPPFPNPGDPQYPYFDIDATNIVNGLVQLPFAQLNRYPYSTLIVRAICTNGFSPDYFVPLQLAPEEGVRDYGATNFINAAVHMKENLKFLLRSGNTRVGFGYASGFHTGFYDNPVTDPWPYDVNDPDYEYCRPPLATNYEHYGFHTYSPNRGYSFIEEARPVRENFFWRNFAFNTVDITNGTFNTGAGSAISNDALEWVGELSEPKYVYWGLGTESPLPLVLTNSGFTWSYWLSAFSDEADRLADAGMYVDASTNLVLPNAVSNIYGLRINSVHFQNNNNQYVTLNRGGSLPAPDDANFFVETEVPMLQTVDYYFASQTRYIKYGSPLQPVPGAPEFSTTNPLPLRITGIGQPITVAGWAKMAITNGYPGTYAYLEQYWDKAYKIATNGTVSTNEPTGLLSPYGEFFPTDPGPVALVTMPDVDTGQSGASLVHVIKVQLDVNHDGVMDLSFGGPDNTSQDRPFVFWLNNDCDRLGNNNLGDDFASTDREANDPYTFKPTPDCEYRDSLGNRIIPHPRDLEDFARLWLAGITTNLFTSLPAGVTAELSWGDKGNPNPNNPTIDIFGTANVSGLFGSGSGIGYLSNSVTAWAQSSNSFTGLRLGPGDSIPVVYSNSFGYQGWNRAIWCGVKRGTGALTLTFKQGTNKLAESSAYIEIKDIKDMYERWSVGDNPKVSPVNLPYHPTDGLPTNSPPFKYAPPADTNTPYILLVHDYDLPAWKKDRWAETAFKRLYWQGYQGRFGLFRWPGVYNGIARPLDDSEFNAWRSSTGLLNLLTNLNAQYSTNVYLMAHGYGAVAAGEALRLAGTNQVVNRYIAVQGAVPSHAYDSSAPFRTIPPSADSGTPDRYSFYNGSACYFAGVGGAGIYINYFNTNDFMLTNTWCSTEDGKPDLIIGYVYIGTNFYKNVTTPLLFPANTYEIFSYCDEARCEAIGAQSNLGGPFAGLLQVDLAGFPYNFKDKDHSAEFLSDCADRWEFWAAVFNSLGLKK